MRDLYWAHLRDDSPNPHTHLIRIIGDFSAPHGWELMEQMSGSIRARISQRFLETSAFGKCGTVTFGHKSRTETYPKVQHGQSRGVVASEIRGRGGGRPTGEASKCSPHTANDCGLSASHPFKTWQDGIEGLDHCIPEDDYSTLPANQRPKIAAEEERPFWTALSNHCQQDEVEVDACRAIHEWMAEA